MPIPVDLFAAEMHRNPVANLGTRRQGTSLVVSHQRASPGNQVAEDYQASPNQANLSQANLRSQRNRKAPKDLVVQIEMTGRLALCAAQTISKFKQAIN